MKEAEECTDTVFASSSVKASEAVRWWRKAVNSVEPNSDAQRNQYVHCDIKAALYAAQRLGVAEVKRGSGAIIEGRGSSSEAASPVHQPRANTGVHRRADRAICYQEET